MTSNSVKDGFAAIKLDAIGMHGALILATNQRLTNRMKLFHIKKCHHFGMSSKVVISRSSKLSRLSREPITLPPRDSFMRYSERFIGPRMVGMF
jgi:hypothetical protein